MNASPPADSLRHRLAAPALAVGATLAVIGAGALLGRVLTSPDWLIAVTVVGLGAIVLTMFANPTAGLLMWIFFAPYAEGMHLTIALGRGIPDLNLNRIGTLVLLLLLFSQVFLRNKPRERGRIKLPPLTWVDLAMLAFSAATFLSVLDSWLGLKNGIQTVFDYVVVPFIVYYLARALLSGRSGPHASVTVIAIAGTCLGLITMREQWTGHALFSPFIYSLIYENHIRRILSVFGSQAIMSTAVAVMVPWLLYGIHSADSARRKIWLSGALLVTLGGVFFTYVRSGWLGAVLAIVVMIALSPATRRAVLPLLPFAAVAVVAVAALAIAPGVIAQRLTSDQPVSYRLQAWKIAWEIFRQSPLLGIGYDNFGRAAAEQFGWNPHTAIMVGTLPSAHNTFLYVLVSSGLIAFLPYLGVYAAIALRAFSFWRLEASRLVPTELIRANRELVAALIATLLGFGVMINIFDAVNAQYPLMVFFLIVGTALGRLERQNQGAIA